MTTIIAVENSNHVLMGSDSQVTSGHSKDHLAQGKIFHNGEYTIGVAGFFQFLQTLEHIELPEPTSGSLYTHMIREVVPAIVEQTKHLVVNTPHGSYTQFEGSSILITVKGQVFQTGSEGSVITSGSGIYSIGSGSPYALGSLANVSGEPTKSDVLHALQAAAKHDMYTGGAFWVKRV